MKKKTITAFTHIRHEMIGSIKSKQVHRGDAVPPSLFSGQYETYLSFVTDF